ncbi:MAG: hypothetical protein LBH48_05095 [Bifidobacteriaceae bacterium]|jgi:hypothetical protein|nr:hypothetical protein [Bifidobacteriaceae bacterium]
MILSEASRDVATGTTRSTIWGGLAGVVMAACSVFDIGAIDALVVRAAEFVNAGASTYVIEAPQLVDGKACQAIATLAGFQAGAMREEPATVATLLPSAPIPTYAVTDGLFDLVPAIEDLGGTGVLASAEVADSLGIMPGGSIETSSGPVRVRGVFSWPPDGRRRGLAFALLAPEVSAGRFDECWARRTPPQADMSGPLLATLLPRAVEDSDSVSLLQLNPSLGEQLNGARSFAGRPSRWAWCISLGGCLMVGLASVRARRLELASALHLGVSRGQLIGMMVLEWAWWTLIALIAAAIASAWAVVAGSGAAPRALADAAALVLGQGTAGSLIGVALGGASIRERALFRYSKSR